eukprot:11403944-Heterocapsa_arctica.AAC.1
MLRATRIHSHKRVKTNKARQIHIVEEDKPEDIPDEEPIDNNDTEYTSCVEKIRTIYQYNIDQPVDRDRQAA